MPHDRNAVMNLRPKASNVIGGTELVAKQSAVNKQGELRIRAIEGVEPGSTDHTAQSLSRMEKHRHERSDHYQHANQDVQLRSS
jgi:hypothetical protein